MPRFVILEHTWNGVHWDLMLEAGGQLRTWAIVAPIAFDVDLPARDLADHRLAYLDYEGPVSGNRGSVRRVERGEYQVLAWTPDRIHVHLTGAQLVGKAALWRAGSKDGGPPAWVFRLGKAD
jgi:DNA polymerase Ligase (LigD)